VVWLELLTAGWHASSASWFLLAICHSRIILTDKLPIQVSIQQVIWL
jgi:hypothetical protein